MSSSPAGSDEGGGRRKRSKKSRSDPQDRQRPNILISGTPGTGKSTLARELVSRAGEGFTWVNVGDFAREHGHLGEWDAEYGAHELEEDALLDDLEDKVAAGGLVLDHHVTDFFPERYFDAVFVLRTDNTLLHDRLTDRGYAGKKLEENVQCEIFQTVLDEARESYPEQIVHELRSDTEQDRRQNVDRILQWFELWKKDHVTS